MPGYRTKLQTVAIAGEDDLLIRSLLDQQQHADPLGTAARLGISSAQWPLFGLLWPSGAQLALLLSARLAQGPAPGGGRILEVGCGLGLASLVAHRRGADVTASDLHPLAGEFLRENLRLNRLPPMAYGHGPWVAPVVAAPGDLHGLFDLIIGSDLLYERDDDATLASFITRHAAPAAEVWIVDPGRGNRPAFHRAMASRGFGLEERVLGGPVHPPQRAPAAPGATPGAVPVYKGRLLVYRQPPGAPG